MWILANCCKILGFQNAFATLIWILKFVNKRIWKNIEFYKRRDGNKIVVLFFNSSRSENLSLCTTPHQLGISVSNKRALVSEFPTCQMPKEHPAALLFHPELSHNQSEGRNHSRVVVRPKSWLGVCVQYVQPRRMYSARLANINTAAQSERIMHRICSERRVHSQRCMLRWSVSQPWVPIPTFNQNISIFSKIKIKPKFPVRNIKKGFYGVLSVDCLIY